MGQLGQPVVEMHCQVIQLWFIPVAIVANAAKRMAVSIYCLTLPNQHGYLVIVQNATNATMAANTTWDANSLS